MLAIYNVKCDNTISNATITVYPPPRCPKPCSYSATK